MAGLSVRLVQKKRRKLPGLLQKDLQKRTFLRCTKKVLTNFVDNSSWLLIITAGDVRKFSDSRKALKSRVRGEREDDGHENDGHVDRFQKQRCFGTLPGDTRSGGRFAWSPCHGCFPGWFFPYFFLILIRREFGCGGSST